MLTLGILEYFFYRLANNGIDLYLLVVFLENMLLLMDAKVDPRLLVAVPNITAYIILYMQYNT